MRVLKKISGILSNVFVVLIAIAAVILIATRMAGLEIYTVLSGSMEPEYHVGSLIWVQKTNAEEIVEGDPITFRLSDKSHATHRVVRIDEEKQCFYTKGDNNETEDGAPVSFSALIGKPVLTIPLLGYAIYFVQNPPGIYIAIGVCAVLLIAAFALEGNKKKKERLTQK